MAIFKIKSKLKDLEYVPTKQKYLSSFIEILWVFQNSILFNISESFKFMLFLVKGEIKYFLLSKSDEKFFIQ